MRIRVTQDIETKFQGEDLRWAMMWTNRYDTDEPHQIEKDASVKALFDDETLARMFQKEHFPKGGIVVRVLDAHTEVQALEEKIAALTKELDESSDVIKTAIDQREEAVSERDKDWVLAFADAIGMDSGLDAPVIPDGVKGCVEKLIAKHAGTAAEVETPESTKVADDGERDLDDADNALSSLKGNVDSLRFAPPEGQALFLQEVCANLDVFVNAMKLRPRP